MEGTTAALQHNLGLGGAVVVTVYKRADGKESKPVSSEAVGKHNRLGYNPAVEAKGFTKAQVDSVRSKKMRSEWAIQDIVSPRDVSRSRLWTCANDSLVLNRSRKSSRDSKSYRAVA